MLNPVVNQLVLNAERYKTSVCVGLDPDFSKMPKCFPQTVAGMSEFLREVMTASLGLCIAFKPNISFFEGMGIPGLTLLESLRSHCPSDVPWIIDGKRGDIGNTSMMQARFLYDHLGADAVTLHPYMGEDSVTPFFEYRNKLSFILGLTSNSGAETFETQRMSDGFPLWQTVIRQCVDWNSQWGNLGLVVGGTQSELSHARSIAGRLPFLIPGVGVQGGDYTTVREAATVDQNLAIINMSRSILYCDESSAFLDKIRGVLSTFQVS